MKSGKFYVLGLNAILLLGVWFIWGCNGTPVPQQHPDEVDSVTHALVTNGFDSVSVSQDRTKGVMTLTGSVQSQERQTYAAQIAHVNASDYVIANDITVTTTPTAESQLTDKYKAVLQAHKNLDLQDVNYEAKNGTLILPGSVHTAHERAEAVKLGKEVPHVEQVIDEIKVEPHGE